MLQPKRKQVHSEERLVEQGFHSDTKELFQPFTQAVTDTTEELPEQSKSTNLAIEDNNENLPGFTKALVSPKESFVKSLEAFQCNYVKDSINDNIRAKIDKIKTSVEKTQFAINKR